MSRLFTQVVYGYDKEEAMKDLNLEIAHNATAKWRNMGEPTFGSAKFNEFCEEFIKNKKITTGGGAYIVKSSATKDTRKRPYSIISNKKEGRTQWKKLYVLCEMNEDGTPGAVISKTATKKSECEADAKAWTAENHKNCMGIVRKEVVNEGDGDNETLFRCIYTPSKSAEQGEFYVFGLVNE